ncbi:hypothetical protein [Streptomyces sp. NPDC047108]|uniref:hypothetical protein n=1 Tax=Streptomyces sp. NPDC047108 TaxID=3155025 RepID=UPI0033C8EA64
MTDRSTEAHSHGPETPDRGPETSGHSLVTPDHSLEALGLADVPALQPLTYPGRPAPGPGLLTDEALLPLAVRPGRLGTWPVGGRTDGGSGPAPSLDDVLTALGRAATGRRHPVAAVGSNASPGQIRYKLTRLGLPVAVPMVPVRFHGIGVAASAHISRPGFVAATPYPAPDAVVTLVVSWLERDQMEALDGTENLNYRRVLLPGDGFAMTMPSGERLPGAYVYASERGLLAGPGGAPRPGGGDQRALLSALLSASLRLRQVFGPGPESWVARAGSDAALRAFGARVFAEEGWVLPPPDFPPYDGDRAGPLLHDDLPPPTGGSSTSR